MARQRRTNEPGTYHHITARGVDRCAIFIDDHDRRQFLALLAEARARFGCKVVAFCLMTNHIHLTLRDDRGALSSALHFLNGVYAKRFNLRHDRTGHLFERRFWSSMLASDEYLTTCAAYVHQNPVAAGIVRNPGDHRWSSYSSYLGLRSVPKFLDTTLLLSHYNDDISQLRAHTEQSLVQGVIVEQLRASNPPGLLSEHPRTALAHPRTACLSPRPDVVMSDVLTACASVAGLAPEDLVRPTPGRPSQARGLAAFIAHRHAGLPLRRIADSLGLGSPAAASMMHRRFADTLESGPNRRKLAEALELLGLPPETC